MMTTSFEVAKFLPGETDTNISIDWPSVHRQAGIDQLEWINQQSPDVCQLMFEKRHSTDCLFLMVEFYCKKKANEYQLLWTK
jgi:hypothetical protein